MPELPEVETIARTLTPLVADRLVTGVQVLLPRSVDADGLSLELLTGRRISTVGRRGKLALIGLQPCHAQPQEAHMLAVHLKMTGRLFVHPARQRPGVHTRVIVHLEGQAGREQLFFDDARTFGYMRLLCPASLGAWPFWAGLGLEPLEHRPEELAARMGASRGAIKALLLDQKLVAGIGNIYADEALFRAGMDPRRKADTLTPQALTRLFAAVQEVLQLSIQQCGASIRDYRTARGDAGAFQNTFRVYGRAGQSCFHCGTRLEGLRVAGRSTVLCPQCQR